ncbi:MAG: carbamoyltransferase HypF [Candidatus Omnitrophica bacterium]|nr:carbamoyltransferase HypF [Candidatus Omnitrophota bacterium]
MSNKVVLALGADIKSRFLLAKLGCLHFGPDMGDLSIAKNYEFFKSEVRRFIKSGGQAPDVISCDLHPGFFSTRFAKELKSRYETSKLKAVQHHHAHIASVLYEHMIRRPVIGVSFDGTGFGTDGNFWGGEFLLVRGSRFKRLAHLKYRMMPGGEKVVYEPWRMALSIVGEKGIDIIRGVKKADKELVLSAIKKGINSPLSSSAGRLFDAAAALLGVCRFASYEAEGPIRLEKMCLADVSDFYEVPFSKRSSQGCNLIDTDAIFEGMMKDLKRGRSRRFIATRFHNSMVEIIVSVTKRLSKRLRIKDVVLSGGVFQNNYLKPRIMGRLKALGLNIFMNDITPANDLNISTGQYYVSCGTSKG